MASHPNTVAGPGSSVTKRTTTNPDGTRTIVTTTTTPSPGGGSTKKTTTEHLPSLPLVRREYSTLADGTVAWRKITTVVYPGGRREVRTEHEGIPGSSSAGAQHSTALGSSVKSSSSVASLSSAASSSSAGRPHAGAGSVSDSQPISTPRPSFASNTTHKSASSGVSPYSVSTKKDNQSASPGLRSSTSYDQTYPPPRPDDDSLTARVMKKIPSKDPNTNNFATEDAAPTKQAASTTAASKSVSGPEINTDDSAPLPPSAYNVSDYSKEEPAAMKKSGIRSQDPSPYARTNNIIAASAFTRVQGGPEIDVDDAAPMPHGAHDVSSTETTDLRAGKKSGVAQDPSPPSHSPTTIYAANEELNETSRSDERQHVEAWTGDTASTERVHTSSHDAPTRDDGRGNVFQPERNDYVVPLATLVQSNNNLQRNQYQRAPDGPSTRQQQHIGHQQQDQWQYQHLNQQPQFQQRNQQPQYQQQIPQPQNQQQSQQPQFQQQNQQPQYQQQAYAQTQFQQQTNVQTQPNIVASPQQNHQQPTQPPQQFEPVEAVPMPKNEPKCNRWWIWAGIALAFVIIVAVAVSVGVVVSRRNNGSPDGDPRSGSTEDSTSVDTPTLPAPSPFAPSIPSIPSNPFSPANTSTPEPVSDGSFPPEGYDVNFCSEIDTTYQMCYASECLGSSTCKCEVYSEEIDSKDIIGVCRSCSVCPNGSFETDCTNIGGGTTTCEDGDTVPTLKPSASSFSVPDDYKFRYCAAQNDEHNLCFASECIDEDSCPCMMYEEEDATSEITGVCSFCDVCSNGSFAADCRIIGYDVVPCESERGVPTPSPTAASSSFFGTPRPTTRTTTRPTTRTTSRPTTFPTYASSTTSSSAASAVSFSEEDYYCSEPMNGFSACVAISCQSPGCPCDAYFRDAATNGTVGDCTDCYKCAERKLRRAQGDLSMSGIGFSMTCTLYGTTINFTCAS